MRTIQAKREHKKRKIRYLQENHNSTCSAICNIFDLGIKACSEKDTLKVSSVINTLKGLVSCKYNGVSSGYYRLYDHCLQFAKDDKFDKASNILYELHQSWNVHVISDLGVAQQ